MCTWLHSSKNFCTVKTDCPTINIRYEELTSAWNCKNRWTKEQFDEFPCYFSCCMQSQETYNVPINNDEGYVLISVERPMIVEYQTCFVLSISPCEMNWWIKMITPTQTSDLHSAFILTAFSEWSNFLGNKFKLSRIKQVHSHCSYRCFPLEGYRTIFMK